MRTDANRFPVLRKAFILFLTSAALFAALISLGGTSSQLASAQVPSPVPTPSGGYQDGPDAEGGSEQATTGMCGRFQDVTLEIDQETRDGIQLLACRNVVGGYPCGGQGEPCGLHDRPYYRPTAEVRRSQIAKVDTLARFYHGAPYTGSNNWDEPLQDIQPGLRTLPSGQLHGITWENVPSMSNPQLRHFWWADQIIFTVAAKQWIIDNAQENRHKVGISYRVVDLDDRCISGSFNDDWYFNDIKDISLGPEQVVVNFEYS